MFRLFNKGTPMLDTGSSQNQLKILKNLVRNGWIEYPTLTSLKATATEQAFEALIDYADRTPGWVVRFNDAGASWKRGAAENGLANSGYFAPYFKNLIGQEHKDQKITYQTCFDFIETMKAQDYPHQLDELDRALLEAASEVVPYMREMVEAMIAFFPAWRPRFFDAHGNPRISVRALKYAPDTLAGTNPHVDKSAFTCIMHTSDDPGQQQRLVVCPPGANVGDLDDYARTGETGKRAVAFAGAALNIAGFDLLDAVPHAVLPVLSNSPRYSLVVFWLLQGVDMNPFDTTVFMTRANPTLRRYAKKTPPTDK